MKAIGNAAALNVQDVATFVLATLQNVVGNFVVTAADLNTATGRITTFFTGSVPVGTEIEWFVFG